MTTMQRRLHGVARRVEAICLRVEGAWAGKPEQARSGPNQASNTRQREPVQGALQKDDPDMGCGCSTQKQLYSTRSGPLGGGEGGLAGTCPWRLKPGHAARSAWSIIDDRGAASLSRSLDLKTPGENVCLAICRQASWQRGMAGQDQIYM